jgi:poly(3-hydroxybutyrate) depolymerase
MMVERFCNENADLLTACAVMSGSLYVGNPPASFPPPARPISIRFERGSADPTIGYCGAIFGGWGPPGRVAIPSVDVDLDYWLSVDGLAPNSMPLCTNAKPTPGRSWLDLKSFDGLVNVQFAERIGGVHDLPQWEVAEAVGWLLEH